MVWVLYLHSQAARRLSSDLRLWTFFRQLPFAARRLVLGEVSGAWLRFTFAAWAAVGVGWIFRPAAPLAIMALLAPFAVGIILLAGVFDVLRRSKSTDLVAGAAPQAGTLGLVLAAGLLALSLVVFRLPGTPVILLLVLLANLLFLLALWLLSARMWRQIR